jgi:hypothetical protein
MRTEAPILAANTLSDGQKEQINKLRDAGFVMLGNIAGTDFVEVAEKGKGESKKVKVQPVIIDYGEGQEPETVFYPDAAFWHALTSSETHD